MPKSDDVCYVNVSMVTCGFTEKDSKSLFELLRHIRVPEKEIMFLTKRLTNICIRSSYNMIWRGRKSRDLSNFGANIEIQHEWVCNQSSIFGNWLDRLSFSFFLTILKIVINESLHYLFSSSLILLPLSSYATRMQQRIYRNKQKMVCILPFYDLGLYFRCINVNLNMVRLYSDNLVLLTITLRNITMTYSYGQLIGKILAHGANGWWFESTLS